MGPGLCQTLVIAPLRAPILVVPCVMFVYGVISVCGGGGKVIMLVACMVAVSMLAVRMLAVSMLTVSMLAVTR